MLSSAPVIAMGIGSFSILPIIFGDLRPRSSPLGFFPMATVAITGTAERWADAVHLVFGFDVSLPA